MSSEKNRMKKIRFIHGSVSAFFDVHRAQHIGVDKVPFSFRKDVTAIRRINLNGSFRCIAEFVTD
jgi:hypothetical protein